jgi:hypothetical protein
MRHASNEGPQGGARKQKIVRLAELTASRVRMGNPVLGADFHDVRHVGPPAAMKAPAHRSKNISYSGDAALNSRLASADGFATNGMEPP